MAEDDSAIFQDGDPDTTISSDTRWKYVTTFLAIIILTSVAIISIGLAASVFTLNEFTQSWMILYGTIALMAAVWAFGKKNLEAVKSFKSSSKK